MKRILVALDGSPRAPGVLAAAVELAKLADGKLVLFRAVGIQPDMPLAILDLTERRLEDVLLDNARQALEKLATGAPRELIAAVVTELATAWDGICRAAKEHDADLVVIGAHGYGRFDRVLGTTAAKVVNHAERNVLVVRTAL